MSDFEFAPPAPASLAVHDSEKRFPVRRIFCVGRNYAAHAREMGKDPDREPPFFFTKPADAVADHGSKIPYPPETADFHYEIELVVAIGQDCVDVPQEAALDMVWGYGVGIDLTRRDLQLAARDKGRPWDWGKAFDLSAPIAPLHRVSQAGHPSRGRIWLSVNGVTRQEADIAELIWDVPEIIAILSRSMALKRGDIIMTGTPAGVGAIVPGDRVTGGIDGLGEIEIEIVEPASAAGQGEGDMMRPVLHNYFRSSTSYRVRIALALKGVDYDYEAFHLRKGEQRSERFLKLNPQGLVPALSWSDGETYTQSLAIIEFLDEQIPEPALLPKDAEGRQRVRSLAQMVALDIHPLNNLRVLVYLKEHFGAGEEAQATWFRHWVAESFAPLEQRLATEPQTGRFCHGDSVTLADICLAAQLVNNKRFNVDMEAYPRIVAIGQALLELEAFRQAGPANQPDSE